jgi:hypothetical protein
MQWPEVRAAYPNQWLVIEALEAHTDHERRRLDQIAVIDVCTDGSAAIQSYRRLHQAYPTREFYFVHTQRDTLEIIEQRWIGVRRGHAVTAEG